MKYLPHATSKETEEASIPVGRKIRGLPEIFVKTNESIVPCNKLSINACRVKRLSFQLEQESYGSSITWYLLFVGLKGASTNPPNVAPLRSPTT